MPSRASFFFAWQRLFVKDTANPPCPVRSHIWCCLLFLWLLLILPQTFIMGIVTPTHWVQPGKTTKDDSCPEYLSFSLPVSQPVLGEEKLGQKKTLLQGPWGFHMLTFFGWQPASLCHAALQEVAFQYHASKKDGEGGKQSWCPTLGWVLSQENLRGHRHSYRWLFLLFFPSCLVIMLQLWNWALFQPGSPWQWTAERRLLLSYQRHCVHGKKMCEELKLYGCTGSLLWW